MRYAVIENKAPEFSIYRRRRTQSLRFHRGSEHAVNFKRCELARTCGDRDDQAFLPLVSGGAIGGRAHTGMVKIEIG